MPFSLRLGWPHTCCSACLANLLGGGGGALWILICLSGASVAFLLRNSAHAHRTVGLPVALLMIAVCCFLAMQMPYSSIIQYLSGHNFTIYIFSWLFQSVVMMLCDRLNFVWYLTFAVMFFAGLLGPMTVIFVYEHIPFLHRYPVRLILGVRWQNRSSIKAINK